MLPGQLYFVRAFLACIEVGVICFGGGTAWWLTFWGGVWCCRQPPLVGCRCCSCAVDWSVLVLTFLSRDGVVLCCSLGFLPGSVGWIGLACAQFGDVACFAYVERFGWFVFVVDVALFGSVTGVVVLAGVDSPPQWVVPWVVWSYPCLDWCVCG
jgi:hypothetical protein